MIMHPVRTLSETKTTNETERDGDRGMDTETEIQIYSDTTVNYCANITSCLHG